MYNSSKHNIYNHKFIFATHSVAILTVLALLSGLFLFSPRVSADSSAVVDVAVDIPASCSIVASRESVSATIIPGNPGEIGDTTIKAVCNDPAGLAVYAIGYTNDTYGNNNLASTAGGTTINIPTAIASSPSTSQWNMTIQAITGTYAPTIPQDFNNTAHIIPTQYTKVAYRNTATDAGTSATGAQFTATFDAYIANDQAAGTYTGKVKFLLVHPATHPTPDTPIAVAHQICYYGNGADEGSMTCQTTIDGFSGGLNTTIASGSSVTLRAPNFSRSGYGFTGWNTEADGTGTQYGPMETITFTQDMYDNGLVLFANWKAAETSATMQTFDDTASRYSTAPNGTVIALRDERDNDVYAVAKLADGNWWMIENLRLDHDANITTSNTQSNNGSWGGVFAGLADPESANFSNSPTANSLYTTDTSSTDLRIITGNNQGYRFPRYNNDNTASRVTNQTSANANIYSYGNYYTWSAAVADTTDYSTKNQSVTSTALCSTGWHLPIGGNKNNFANSEWWILTRLVVGFDPTNYDSSNYPYYTNSNAEGEGTDASKAMRRYPINLMYSGVFSSSSASVRGTAGSYWSSTVEGSINAFFISLGGHGNNVDPTEVGNNKYLGHSVRCLAD